MDSEVPDATDAALCKHCGGPKGIRNPTGSCDHLYWPELLTEEAKTANGFHKRVRVIEDWVSPSSKEADFPCAVAPR